MATYTERTYPSTIRVELDKDGNTVKREIHRRTDTLKDGVVILSVDERLDSLDATAFQDEITDQYAAAIEQIDTLTTEKAALIKQLADVNKELAIAEAALTP